MQEVGGVRGVTGLTFREGLRWAGLPGEAGEARGGGLGRPRRVGVGEGKGEGCLERNLGRGYMIIMIVEFDVHSAMLDCI